MTKQVFKHDPKLGWKAVKKAQAIVEEIAEIADLQEKLRAADERVAREVKSALEWRARAKKRLRWGFGIRRSSMWDSAWGAGTDFAYFGLKKWKRQANISQGRYRRPSIGESVEPERRAKALGPHSERAGVAPRPRERMAGSHPA